MYVPNFGIIDLTFLETPLQEAALLEEIRSSEPRATLSINQNIPATDSLMDQLTIGVTLG